MKLKQLFILLLIINSATLISVVFILSEYQRAVDQLENAYKMQHRSLILADELRQSSDDLTRMARTHVITGKEMFKEQFHTVLDIRNGLKPRPKYYNRIFWDFYTLDGSNPILDGQKIPLRTLMKQAGFPEEELSLLFKSQKESDDLTNLETKAMNAIKGIFQDRNGNYTIKKEPNFKLAREIMHSDEYHRAKIAIMKPLNEFYKAFETRTQTKVNEAHITVKKMETYLSLAVLFLIILFVFSFIFIILYRIIQPVEMLNKGMLKLAKNEMDIDLPQKVFMDEISEMIGAVEVFKDNAIKLIDSQKQNKRLLDLAGEGIFGLDSKGRFIFVNPTASELLGYNSKELIGQYINKTITKHLTNKAAQQKERLMLVSKENQTFISKNGKEFPIDYVSTPIFSNNSTILEGSVVVFSDITKRKEYENQLKKATIEAQNANRSKSIFLTNMSHELRTPLNAILGFTTLLKKSKSLINSEKQNIETIHRSGQHLLSLINEILEFAKIEAGKVNIVANDFNLYKLLEEIESLFTSKCEDKALSFRLKIENSVPKYIKCDEKRLRQIFINILGNALKFTEKGSVTVLVEALDSKLKVTITDTGIGIKKEALELIFIPFEQINEHKQKQAGTGLGLAITKELIEKMGGKISVESKEDEGSCFCFEVDYEKIESIEFEEIEADKIIKIKKPTNAKILVADDTKANRDLLVQFLNSYNITTTEAKDGLEVLKLCKEQRFDLIFMDILMPNLDGLQTTLKIKSDNDLKNIPIIAISANVFEDDRQKALNSGADDFLPKPFEERDITHTLEKFLNLEFEYEEKIDFFEEAIVLEKELAIKIKDYAINLDGDSIIKLLKEKELNLKTKKEIEKLVEEFNYQKILELCIKVE
ncbi:ATP-binding protein [Halarcobacter ebronensis]|uniref:histidine kinase n=1 Tax=Halarcobacter ebronensis TaxID=1462615 RepID=A0A4Q1B061_9BACT|nr:ATP-binding protein [Halarcobacter ebronensis]QKF80557.1 two-component system sensor histidine kinase/response regulator fusion protein [Halarcobacter ebronensis]RXK08363.1 hybrid sensor histidine kinase/response regulator [Halarcobacter ebronensis]